MKGFINVRDINQELLLNIPDLLPRLVNIACNKNCEYHQYHSRVDRFTGLKVKLFWGQATMFLGLVVQRTTKNL